MLTTSSMENSTPEKEFCALAVVTLPKISLYRYENSQRKFQSFSPQSSMVEFLLRLQFKLLFQCWKFGAIQADITHRRSTKLAYPGKSLELMVCIKLEDKSCRNFLKDWPKMCVEKPILTNINGSTVTFKDGTKADYDVIIKCTGYKHSFPFLSKGN